MLNFLQVLLLKCQHKAQAIDTIFLNNIPCQYPAIKGFFESDNNLLIAYSNYNVDVDKYQFTDSLFFDWIDSTGTVLSSNSHFYGERGIQGDDNYFPKNTISFDRENEKLRMFPYFISNDTTVIQTVLEMDSQGVKQRENNLSDLFGDIEVGNDGYYYGIRDTTLTKLDDSFNRVWSVELPYDDIEDFKVLPSGEVLVLLQQYRADNRIHVGLVSKDGVLISLKAYGGEQRRPKKIVLVGNESFAVLGTKWIPYEDSDFGNPYAKVFVLKDKISNLETYTSTEKVGNTFDRMLVYPNPSSDLWNVWLPSKNGISTLYSALGNVIFKKNNGDSEVIQLGNSTLQKGLYFLHWHDPTTNQTLTARLIKQ